MLEYYQMVDFVTVDENNTPTEEDYTIYSVPMSIKTNRVQELIEYAIEQKVNVVNRKELELHSTLKPVHPEYGRMDTIVFYDIIDFDLFCIYLAIELEKRGL